MEDLITPNLSDFDASLLELFSYWNSPQKPVLYPCEMRTFKYRSLADSAII
jgi:hypothetical protein